MGVGKSTQIKLLAEHFKSKGLKVNIAGLKVGNLWAYPLYKIALIGWPIFKNKYMFKMWVVLDLIAISLKFLISIWLPFKAGRLILVEEYIPAIVADYLHIARINGYPPKDVRAIIAYTSRLATLVPFTSVFLDADTAVIRERWKSRGTSDEKLEYILVQQKLLPLITKLLSHRLIYIATSDSSVKETSYYLKEHLIN